MGSDRAAATGAAQGPLSPPVGIVPSAWKPSEPSRTAAAAPTGPTIRPPKPWWEKRQQQVLLNTPKKRSLQGRAPRLPPSQRLLNKRREVAANLSSTRSPAWLQNSPDQSEAPASGMLGESSGEAGRVLPGLHSPDLSRECPDEATKLDEASSEPGGGEPMRTDVVAEARDEQPSEPQSENHNAVADPADSSDQPQVATPSAQALPGTEQGMQAQRDEMDPGAPPVAIVWLARAAFLGLAIAGSKRMLRGRL